MVTQQCVHGRFDMGIHVSYRVKLPVEDVFATDGANKLEGGCQRCEGVQTEHILSRVHRPRGPTLRVRSYILTAVERTYPPAPCRHFVNECYSYCGPTMFCLEWRRHPSLLGVASQISASRERTNATHGFTVFAAVEVDAFWEANAFLVVVALLEVDAFLLVDVFLDLLRVEGAMTGQVERMQALRGEGSGEENGEDDEES